MSALSIVAVFNIFVASILVGGGAAYVEHGVDRRRFSAILTGALAFLVGNEFYRLARLLLTIAARTQP